MNYKYKIGNEDVILSSDEHKKVLETGGKQIVILRNGKLAINPSYIQMVKETEQLTLDQENKKLENPMVLAGLENSKKKTSEYLKQRHFSFYEKNGWDHEAEDCACKTWVLK